LLQNKNQQISREYDKNMK